MTCNQPTRPPTRAATSPTMTYDATHGGVLTVTAPAPAGGVAAAADALLPITPAQRRISLTAISACPSGDDRARLRRHGRRGEDDDRL